MANKNNKRSRGNKNNNRGDNRKRGNDREDKRESGKTERGKSEDVGMATSDNHCINNVNKPDNDPSWYMKNEQLFKDASQYWISQVTGSKMNFNIKTAQGLTAVDYATERQPGIIALNWVPSTGRIQRDDSYTSSGSEFQVFAKNIYNFMTHANSRSNVSYEAADIAMTVLAADSIYSAISAAVRAYGIARTIIQENRYYGEAMLTAMGFNAADVVSNLAKFRMDINYLIAKASTIWVPSDVDLIKRHYWMNTNIYTDSEDATGQCYLYRQKVYYLWNPKTSTQGSMLSPIVVSNNMTTAQWFTMVTNMLNAILDDDDPQTMMADMLKAYGAENLFALQPITEDYTVVPVHNYEVLLQIHNTDIAYMTDGLLGTLTVQQDVSTQAIFQIYDHTHADAGSTLSVGYVGPTLIDFPSGYTVSKEAVMIATRNKISVDIYEQNSVASLAYYTGTELFVNSSLWYYDQNGALQETAILSTHTSAAGTIYIGVLRTLAQRSRFDFAPFVYIVEWTDTTAFSRKQKLWAVQGDNNNGRPLLEADLRRLHQVAILSELNVPYMK